MKNIKVIICISPSLNEKFRRFIQDKYQMYEKGLLSYEATQALEHWVALHTKAQKSLMDVAPNPMPKVSMAFLQLKRYLLNQYYEEIRPGTTVPDKYLRDAIRQTRGSDKRTVRKWLRIFTDSGLVKRLNQAVWELL